MRPDVSAQVGAINASWQQDQTIVVRGSTGSGVHTLASDLSRQPRCAVVEFRALSQDDTSAAFVLEAASHVDARQQIVASLGQPANAASLLANAINDEGRSLVLVIPRANDTQDERRLLERLRAVTRPLQKVKHLALLGAHDFDPALLGLSPSREAVLGSRLVELAPSEFPVGKYRESAEQLRAQLQSLSLSPLVWRLAVGLISQGGAVREAAGLCELSTAEALPQLSRELAQRIETNEPLKLATQQLLLARRPLPVSFLTSFQLGIDQPFLTHCLGYGEPVRVAEPVRLSLLRALPPPSPFSHAGHSSLATHYRALDGVLSPQQIHSPAGIALRRPAVAAGCSTADRARRGPPALPSPRPTTPGRPAATARRGAGAGRGPAARRLLHDRSARGARWRARRGHRLKVVVGSKTQRYGSGIEKE